MPVANMVYSSIAPPRAGLTSAENAAEWTQTSSLPSPSKSSTSPGEPLALAAARLGLRQVAPDRVPQVRQIEPAEDAVPVGVVALRAADGAAHRGRVAPARGASALSAIIFLCIRFDSEYLTRKFRQCAPRMSAPSGPATRASPRSRSSRVSRSAASGGSDQPSISR